MLKLKQRGDTIVEVMIVLAILGLAISICYATANRSLLNTRQAQENGAATELLRGQIEALRSVSCSGSGSSGCVRPSAVIDVLNAPFCMVPQGTGYEAKPYTAVLCDNGIYTIKIVNQDTTAGKFLISASWPGVTGGTDTVNLTYRLPR